VVERDGPPEHLMSFPLWLAQSRSPDPARAEAEWEQARAEWARGAPTLAARNRLFEPGFNPGPMPDPRVVRR